LSIIVTSVDKVNEQKEERIHVDRRQETEENAKHKPITKARNLPAVSLARDEGTKEEGVV
jgi:hypothetical protein